MLRMGPNSRCLEQVRPIELHTRSRGLAFRCKPTSQGTYRSKFGDRLTTAQLLSSLPKLTLAHGLRRMLCVCKAALRLQNLNPDAVQVFSCRCFYLPRASKGSTAKPLRAADLAPRTKISAGGPKRSMMFPLQKKGT